MAEVGVYSSEQESKLPGRTDQRCYYAGGNMAGTSLGQDIPTDVRMQTKGLAPELRGYLNSGKE